MKTKYNSTICSQCHPFSAVCIVAVAFLFGVLSDSAQTVNYLYSGSELILTLDPGTYDITTYGAEGGTSAYYSTGGLGAEMEGQFSFATAVNLVLLVGGEGGGAYYAGGGGGGSFVVNGATPLVIAGGGGGAGVYVPGGGSGLTGSSGGNAGGQGGSNGLGGGGGGPAGVPGYNGGGGGGGYIGNGANGVGGGAGGNSFLNGGAGGSGYNGGSYEAGGYGGGGASSAGAGGGGGYSGGGGGVGFGDGGGGGSYIDASAVAYLTEISGVASPDDSPNGEIIITAVQIQQPQVPPPLLISCSGSTVTVSWQNVFTWKLQQNSNLANPSGWTASSGVTSVNDTNYLSVTASSDSLFFRLQEQ